jgi:carbon storage regulator
MGATTIAGLVIAAIGIIGGFIIEGGAIGSLINLPGFMIVIGGDVVVRLLSIDGERVKIGVEAPRSISVLREQLLVELAGENQAAAAFHGHAGLADALRSLGPATAERRVPLE